jgi:chromosome segregation ATPase
MSVGLKRMADQRAQTQVRSTELEAALADGDLPIVELEGKLKDFLARRLEVESELATERRALEEADNALRSLDEKRLDAETRVNCSARGDGKGPPGSTGIASAPRRHR